MSWDQEEWRRYFEEWEGEEVEVAFETSPEAYRAKAILDGLGVKYYPFHAASFGAVTRSKRKTDKIDAEKICRALRSDGLPERVVLPEKEEARLRNLVQEREAFLEVVVEMVNRVKGLGRQWGVDLPTFCRDNHPGKWWEEAIESFGGVERGEVRRAWMVTLAALQGLDELEEEIKHQVKKAGLQKEVEQLKTIPGIGEVIAPGVAAYLGNGRRFRTSRKFGGYTGMTPTVGQTGVQAARLGHITHEGPAVLRRLLVQAARAAVRGKQLEHTRWKRWFERLKKRRGWKIAIVGLARKIAVVCKALIRDGTQWDPRRLQ